MHPVRKKTVRVFSKHKQTASEPVTTDCGETGAKSLPAKLATQITTSWQLARGGLTTDNTERVDINIEFFGDIYLI